MKLKPASWFAIWINRVFVPIIVPLYDKWKQVISRLPKHQITGDKIDEELGHLKPARKRINVTREVAEQLEQEAALSGVKTNQLLKELLEERENSKDILFGLNPKLRAPILKEAERNGLTIEEVLEKYFPEDEEESDQAQEDKDDKNNVRSLHSRTSKDQTMDG